MHYIKKKNKKSKKHKDDRRTRPWGRGECMLGYVLQGPPMFTHASKAEADTRKKEDPPRTPTQTKTTQPGNASKEDRNKHNTPQRHENKKDRQARRSTSRTQDHGWTGKPTTVPLTPGSKTRVLHANTNERKKNKTNNKQHVPATHVSYQSTNHTQQTTQRKKKQDPGGRKGNESTNQR